MKTILVTGASGFIGRHLIKSLKTTEEYKNSRLVLLTSNPIDEFECINHEAYSFTDEIFKKYNIELIDMVFHLGSFTPKSNAEANSIDNSFLNIKNTLHLINNLPNIPEKFLYTSTIDVYNPIDGIINEQTPTNPESLYGQSKLFCEKMLAEWASQKKVILQILRIGHIYGPGEDAYQKIIPKSIINIIENKSPLIWTSGKELRSFLYVEDACDLIIKAGRLDKYMQPINIVSSVSKSIIEIVEMIIEISKKNIRIDIKNNNSENIKNFIFNSSKMNTLLGYETTTLQQGLKLEYDYFRLK